MPELAEMIYYKLNIYNKIKSAIILLHQIVEGTLYLINTAPLPEK
jgi:hypothetical protein